MTNKERIQEIIKELSFIRSKKNHFEELKEQRAFCLEEFNLAEQKLSFLYSEIDKLERMSLKSVARFLMGKKHAKLVEYRELYSDTSMEMRGLNESIELLDYQIKVLEDTISHEKELEQELNLLMGQRERALMKGFSVRETLKNHQQKIIEQDRILTQLKEVKIFVHEYKRQVEKLISRLTSGETTEDSVLKAESLFPLCRTRYKEMNVELKKIDVVSDMEDICLYKLNGKSYNRHKVDDNPNLIKSLILSNFKKYKEHLEEIETSILRQELKAKSSKEAHLKKIKETAS